MAAGFDPHTPKQGGFLASHYQTGEVPTTGDPRREISPSLPQRWVTELGQPPGLWVSALPQDLSS